MYSVVNEGPVLGGMGITLLVGGQIISGNLVGRKEWVDRHSIHENLDAPDEVISAFIDSFQQFGEDSDDTYTDDAWIASRTNFIHLKDAFYVTAQGNIPTNCNTLWRGNLSSVDGWNLGKLGPTPSASHQEW